MLNGDFPMYTKKVIRDLYAEFKKEKEEKLKITDDKLDLLKNKFNKK